jgi:hypothetical protein
LGGPGVSVWAWVSVQGGTMLEALILQVVAIGVGCFSLGACTVAVIFQFGFIRE